MADAPKQSAPTQPEPVDYNTWLVLNCERHRYNLDAPNDLLKEIQEQAKRSGIKILSCGENMYPSAILYISFNSNKIIADAREELKQGNHLSPEDRFKKSGDIARATKAIEDQFESYIGRGSGTTAPDTQYLIKMRRSGAKPPSSLRELLRQAEERVVEDTPHLAKPATVHIQEMLEMPNSIKPDATLPNAKPAQARRP